MTTKNDDADIKAMKAQLEKNRLEEEAQEYEVEIAALNDAFPESQSLSARVISVQ